jgi:hypothetical protein
MTSWNKPPDNKGRARIITAVRTPLGFFTLAILVVEAILGATVAITSGEDRRVALIGMLMLLAILIVGVGLLVVFRPAALQGRRQEEKPERSASTPMRVGAEVRIRDDFPQKSILHKDGVVAWNVRMKTYLGRTARIVGVEDTPRVYVLDVDERQFKWAPEWLENSK